MRKLGLPVLLAESSKTGYDVIPAENPRMDGMNIATTQYRDAKAALREARDRNEIHARELQLASAEQNLRGELNRFAPVENPQNHEIPAELQDTIANAQYVLYERTVGQRITSDRQLERNSPAIRINDVDGNHIKVEIREGQFGWDFDVKRAFTSAQADRVVEDIERRQNERGMAFDAVAAELLSALGQNRNTLDGMGIKATLRRVQDMRRAERPEFSQAALDAMRFYDELNETYIAEGKGETGKKKEFSKKGNPSFMEPKHLAFLISVLREEPIING